METHPPRCIGIIMDGNRRWARERGIPAVEGHRAGYAKLKEAASWCRDAGVQHLAVYAFSTENWNRTADEVSYLMDLFRIVFEKELSQVRAEGTAVHVIGQEDRLPKDMLDMVSEIHSTNPPDAAHHLWLCVSYGGRAEILAAVNALLASGAKSVSEDAFTRALWTADMPDPDIIIRTGGEHRLSGFLTWSSVYSELFFTKEYWPDLSKEHFLRILSDYALRERRLGK